MPNYNITLEAVLQAFLSIKTQKIVQIRFAVKKEVDYCKKVCYDNKENRGLVCFYVFAQYF